MDASPPDGPDTSAEAPTDATTDATTDDLEALRAERDALQAELDAQSHRRGIGERLRRIAAPALVIVFAMSLLSAGVGVWLHRNTLNDDVWAERVVPLGQDPAVQAALATWTTDELMTLVDPKGLFEQALPDRADILAVPLSSAVRNYVSGKVDEFFASDRFEELWATAAVRAHDAAVQTLRGERPAVEADDEKVTINLIPLIDAVLNRILDAVPGLVGSDAKVPQVSVEDVPAAARDRIAKALGVDVGDDFGTITVYDGGALSSAQVALRWFDKLVVLTMLLTVVSGVAALWVSPRRRRTLFQLLGATALVTIVVRRVSFTLQDQVTQVVKEANQAAAKVVVATFIDPLTAAAATILWVTALIGVIAAVTGPYRWAVSLRSALSGGAQSIVGAAGALTATVGERAGDPGTALWVSAHADALRIAGYGLGAVLLWFAELSWVSLLLIGLVVTGWQVLLHRLVAASPLEGPTDSAEEPGG